MFFKNIYLAERGFITLNIELGIEDVKKLVEATGESVEGYRDLILAC